LFHRASRKLEQYLVTMMDQNDGETLSAWMRMPIADIRAEWRDLVRRMASGG
jgi:hypothetical protein